MSGMSGPKIALISAGFVIAGAFLSAAIGTLFPQIGVLRALPVAAAASVICLMVYEHVSQKKP